jgi:hypothetical protein
MLERLDLSLKMPRDEYDHWLKTLQADLHQLAYQVYLQKIPVILVLKAWMPPARAAPSNA